MTPVPCGGKTVLILCGPSGAGKSTWAAGFDATHCSANDWFSRGGEYNFDPKLLPEAHGYCLRLFCEAAAAGSGRIIVDNTNTTLLEMAPYYAVAIAHGYSVEIHSFGLTMTPEALVARGKHGCPVASVSNQLSKLHRLMHSQTIPPFWTYKLVNHP